MLRGFVASLCAGCSAVSVLRRPLLSRSRVTRGPGHPRRDGSVPATGFCARCIDTSLRVAGQGFDASQDTRGSGDPWTVLLTLSLPDWRGPVSSCIASPVTPNERGLFANRKVVDPGTLNGEHSHHIGEDHKPQDAYDPITKLPRRVVHCAHHAMHTCCNPLRHRHERVDRRGNVPSYTSNVA